MKLLFVFHSIIEDSGMENLLLGIKNFSNINITILYQENVSTLIKNNFTCILFNNISKSEIQTHDCLVFFKENKKDFNLSHEKFQSIKKICAIFYPLELSESYNNYNFSLASSIITNFKTNIKKLNSITNLNKFFIHHAFAQQDQINNIDFDQIDVGIIGSANNLQFKKILRVIEKTSKTFKLFDGSNDFYKKCKYILIHDQSDFLHHLFKASHYKKDVILYNNHFTNEFKNYPILYYKEIKDIYDILFHNVKSDASYDNLLETTNILVFIEKLKEIIYCNIGFPYENKRVSYYDSGTFITNNWQVVDQALSKSVDYSGIRFFSYVDREIKYRHESLKNWIGMVHSKTILPEDVAESNKGIFVFSEHAKEFLHKQYPNLNIEKLNYPTVIQQEKFNYDRFYESKKIYAFENITNLDSNLIFCPINEGSKSLVDGLVYLEFDNYWPYDLLVECMERNIPIVTKRHPITEEYLGNNYPLFIDDKFIFDKDKIKNAYLYLKNYNKEKFRIEEFIKSITSSNILTKIDKESKPLIRITLGRTSKDGYEITYYNFKSLVKCYGTEKFDYCLCHNNINDKRLSLIEKRFQNVKSPIRFYKQNNADLPLPIRFSNNIDATVHHNISAGSFWKICPPRLRDDSHEIIIDNDIVFLRALPEIEKFLNSNLPMTLEDSSIHMGFYEHTRDFNKELTLNSGVIGLPPKYNFEKKILNLWNLTKPNRGLNGGDEQGLLTSILSKGDHILIPRSHIIGLHPEKIHVNAFSSGTPTYQILKRNTERDFINYFRIDFHKLSQKTYAFHFYQINRSSLKHRAWNKFLDYYQYLQSPNSLK